MIENSSAPVLVAVGADPMDAALAFAVEEAVALGCALQLVHVVHLPTRGPEVSLAAERNLEGGRPSSAERGSRDGP